MKELNFEELSVKQKLGMVMHALFFDANTAFEENIQYTLELIKNHSLGAVWVYPKYEKAKEIINLIRETADYPVLIFTDAESGMPSYEIGHHNAIGMTDSIELAYVFGKITAIEARSMGYNVVCNPLLDMAVGDTACSGNMRSLGSDKYKVTALARAIAKAMHDGGVLTVGKHYPGAIEDTYTDSHMAESHSSQTKEELLETSLYPYITLYNEGLLDGIMTGHVKMPNIDSEHPASLSKKIIDIIREQGFDGFSITDALPMMGIQAKYGPDKPCGMAIAAGNDIALTWTATKDAYERMIKCYEDGIITDDALDSAVKRVLAAQHKVMLLSHDAEITKEDVEKFNRISTDGIYAKTDDGISPAISKDGKHLFAVVVKINQPLDNDKLPLETMTNSWYKPELISKRIKELFKNSEVHVIPEFPTHVQNFKLLNASMNYDDVIFINFAEARPYQGSDHITQRLASVVNSLITSNKLSAIINFGNPYVLEDINHVERILTGTASTDSTMAALEVIAGNYPAKGTLTYDVNFK